MSFYALSILCTSRVPLYKGYALILSNILTVLRLKITCFWFKLKELKLLKHRVRAIYQQEYQSFYFTVQWNKITCFSSWHLTVPVSFIVMLGTFHIYLSNISTYREKNWLNWAKLIHKWVNLIRSFDKVNHLKIAYHFAWVHLHNS